MSYDVQVREVQRGPLAVARGRATSANLSQQIRALFDQVYAFLGKGTVRQEGQNVVVYLNEAGKNLLASPAGCPIEVGVQVAASFEPDSAIFPSITPAGIVATVVHMGPYEQLVNAHKAVHQWCANNHRALAGPNWEIYGDWSDQLDQLRTDVFYLLAEGQ
jgi:effector-binding domain-containing protein